MHYNIFLAGGQHLCGWWGVREMLREDDAQENGPEEPSDPS